VSKEEIEKIRHALFGAAYTVGGQDYSWLFKHLDKDHNGSLDPREFESCVRKVLKIGPAGGLMLGSAAVVLRVYYFTITIGSETTPGLSASRSHPPTKDQHSYPNLTQI
jgi:hypothetical protein